MRQIVLDTETTGLTITEGHRIIEIGAVELIDRQLTNKTYHQYLNPERDMDDEAIAVHGITRDQLNSEPLFSEVVDEFLAFIKDADIIIHNAPFDVGFLDYEISLLTRKYQPLQEHCAKITDSLAIAKKLRAGQRNNLDALCRFYGIDSSKREKHGALLDAELLARVYLSMTSGQLDLSLESSLDNLGNAMSGNMDPEKLSKLKVLKASVAEMSAHNDLLAQIEAQRDAPSLWRQLEPL